MVAATFGRTMFACAECAEHARRGIDLKGEHSGAPSSCDGPREWTFYRSHPSGGFTWHGCPRRSLDVSTDAVLRLYDRADARLSYTEQRRAPWALLDAFEALDFVRGCQAWEEQRKIEAMSAGGEKHVRR